MYIHASQGMLLNMQHIANWFGYMSIAIADKALSICVCVCVLHEKWPKKMWQVAMAKKEQSISCAKERKLLKKLM